VDSRQAVRLIETLVLRPSGAASEKSYGSKKACLLLARWGWRGPAVLALVLRRCWLTNQRQYPSEIWLCNRSTPERQKFSITIEETKPLVSDELYQNYCFGDDAIQALKGLQLGQPVNVLDIKTGGHTFLSLDEYFRVCQARYVLKFSGEPSKIETDKYSDNTNRFHDQFTCFRNRSKIFVAF
jgi:hypothetical protein